MKSAEKKEVCEALGGASKSFAQAMNLLNKPTNAYWFRKAETAYDNGYYRLGRLFYWYAKRSLYREDWRDIQLYLEYGKI